MIEKILREKVGILLKYGNSVRSKTAFFDVIAVVGFRKIACRPAKEEQFKTDSGIQYESYMKNDIAYLIVASFRQLYIGVFNMRTSTFNMRLDII